MKAIWGAILLLATMSCAAWGADYQYISTDEMNARLATKSETVIVDICDAEQFAKGHLPGSIETNAYPVKTDEERARLEPAFSTAQQSEADVVIVCPRGGGGAKRTYDRFQAKGIATNRLYILEGGMDGWPHESQSN